MDDRNFYYYCFVYVYGMGKIKMSELREKAADALKAARDVKIAESPGTIVDTEFHIPKKLYVISQIETFRHRYVIEATEEELDEQLAKNSISELNEFSQEHLGEYLIEYYEIDEKEYLKMFDRDNDYLSSWDKDLKLTLINKV